ncbi:hypothetical protein ASD89_20200 [Caulobacter sp. Root656]|nr:hypothetical protein ASD89_20200 [Caulobacter sp. Root656]
MILSLDTNVIIDLVRGRRPAVRQRHRLAVLNSDMLVASLMVFHELQFGVAIGRDSEAEARAVEIVLQGISIEPFTEQDMLRAAQVRARLRSLGRPIGAYDVLIAGQALARGWTLVTSNVAEFARVDGLDIQDWSRP